MAVRKKRIEALTQKILCECNVTEPPVPIEEIARRYGLQIRFQALQSDLSGFLYREQQRGVIGVNSFHPKVRQRFTMAHELGHFFLHQNDALYVDKAVQAKFRNNLSQQGIDEDEMEANLFAAEILMPRDLIAQDLERTEAIDILDEDFDQLAHRYNVSTQALFLRLMNLGYVEE